MEQTNAGTGVPVRLVAWARARPATVFVIAGYAAWMIFLAIVASISSRDPFFFDVIAQADVSTEYVSVVPAERQAFEPFFILVTMLGINMTDVLLGFVLVYVVTRLAYLVVARLVFKVGHRGLAATIVAHARNVINCFWKHALLALGTGVLIVAIVLATSGFLGVVYMYMRGLITLAWFCTGLLAFKIVQNLVIFVKKGVPLKVKPRKLWTTLPKRSPRYWVHKVPDVAGREVRYAVGALLVFAALVFSSLTLHVPTHRITATTLAPGEYLFDFHVHTWHSDGSLSPAARVDWYINQGIHGAAFSDHNTIRGALEAREYVERAGLNFTVIIAQEYTMLDPYVHLNIYGLEWDYAPPAEYEHPTWTEVRFLNISDMIADVKANGGFVTVNHYGADGSPYTYAQFRDWGVDGFEIVNGGREHSAAIRAFCLANNLALLSATDEHMNWPLTSFTRVQVNDPANVSEIFSVLKTNSHQAVLVRLHGTPPAGAVASIPGAKAFLAYFTSLEPGSLVSWVAWSTAGFVALVACLQWAGRRPFDAALVEDPAKGSIMFKGPRLPTRR